MPHRPPTPCRHPGCPALTHKLRCPEHAREVDRRRGTTHERGYGIRWRRLRLLVLARDPYCQHPDCHLPATEVDHVIPKRAGGTDELSNLQGLCKSHHSAKTMREVQGGVATLPSRHADERS